MIDRLCHKLSQQRRNELRVAVRERNLDAQRFFAAQGFRAAGVLRGQYEESDEDAYVMKFKLVSEPDQSSPWHPANRITQYLAEECQ